MSTTSIPPITSSTPSNPPSQIVGTQTLWNRICQAVTAIFTWISSWFCCCWCFRDETVVAPISQPEAIPLTDEQAHKYSSPTIQLISLWNVLVEIGKEAAKAEIAKEIKDFDKDISDWDNFFWKMKCSMGSKLVAIACVIKKEAGIHLLFVRDELYPIRYYHWDMSKKTLKSYKSENPADTAKFIEYMKQTIPFEPGIAQISCLNKQ